MPRRGENIYKRKDGRWECRLKKPDGKYHYIYARTYRELKDKRDRQPFLCDDTECSGLSCAQEGAGYLFEHWLKNDVAARVKPSTYENYYRCICKYVIPFFGESAGSTLTEESASLFTKSVIDDKKLSQSSKRKVLSIFKTAMKDIMANMPQSSEVISKIKLPKVQNPEIQVFTVAEQTQIENTALIYEDKRALGIMLCFYTGIRLGELCGLRWGDLDVEAGTMNIARTVARTKNFQSTDEKTSLLVGTPKSQHSVRKIPVPDFLVEMAKSKIGFHSKSSFVLTGTEKPLDPRTFQKLYKRVLKRAGVNERKFHAIRHTFATRALELGIDIKTLSEILGHSNVSITMNIYAHSLLEQKRIAMDKLNSMHLDHMKSSTFAVTSSVSAPC